MRANGSILWGVVSIRIPRTCELPKLWKECAASVYPGAMHYIYTLQQVELLYSTYTTHIHFVLRMLASMYEFIDNIILPV